MTRSIRFVIAGLGGFLALASAGSAFGKSYEPSLLLMPSKHTLGSTVGVGIGIDQGECCFAPGRITLYSPPGYGVKLGHPAGRRMGSLLGVLRLREEEHRATGVITADNPANHLTNSCAPGAHDAVWMLAFEASPYRFRVPMYVDRVATGTEASHASARMLICFASPYVPPPQGAPAGLALGGMAFGVADVFTNPSSQGSYPWNAVSVPYAPGTATLSSELATQSTSYVRLPVALNLTVKRLRRGSRTFVVTACLRENGQALRGRVQILGRPAPRGAFTTFGAGRTNARGCITRRVRPKSKVVFGVVLVELPPRVAAGCSAALAPHCSRPTFASFGLMRTFRIRR